MAAQPGLIDGPPAGEPQAAAPAAAGTIAAVRSRLRALRADALADFQRDGEPRRLLRQLCRVVDAALRDLWLAHAARGDGGQPRLPAAAALVAVGGYGRGDLFPHSDVDILVLLPEGHDEQALRATESFVGACWDAGIEIGHSVRTPSQCLHEAAGDVTVRTALLEMRPLAGSRAAAARLARDCSASMDARAFFRAKMLELRQRHAKHQDTPYSLEPNCKESPGGLRDLHAVLWVARAAGLGRSWPQLARRGMLTAAEARSAAANERMLLRIRAHLHVLARRREDRLAFDLQAPLARALGIGAAQSDRRASEHLMQRYYWAAKAVLQLSTIVLQNIEAELFPQVGDARAIDAQFSDRGGLLEIVDEGLFERDPSAILRAFRTMQQHAELTGMSARTMRAIWRARGRIDARFRRDPVNRAMFMQIVRSPRGITHEFRRMNQLSVLGRYLPAFRSIVGRMQHDLFHVYTVDQHILMVMRNLRRFTMPEHAHEYPLCSELMASFGRPWLLYIAALFHDIAKGRGGDHSELGRVDARRFCRVHGLAPWETRLVDFLVAEHLTMSSVAQKRDLTDPAVIDEFAQRVGTMERLTALYLLTVADIRGTSPKVWNAWKGKLLEDLYRATARVLGGERPDAHAMIDATRTEATRLLNLQGLDPEAYRDFWARLDVSYFLRHEPADIAWHTRTLFRHRDESGPLVRTRLASIGEGFQVTTWLPDQPDLFARICGYFDRKNLSILDARIYTTRDGRALDTFLVHEPGFAGSYRDVLQLVESELAEALRLRAPPGAPVRGRASRRSRSFPLRPRVDLRPDERGQHYLLSVTAGDRTGLLYGIARVLAERGINLRTARISTLGERAEDSFLIDGPGLSDERVQIDLETELLKALEA